MKIILNTAIRICGILAVVFEPFLPFMSEKLSRMLRLGKLSWGMTAQPDLVPAGTRLGETELLFEKIEDSTVEFQIGKLLEAKKKNQLAAWKPEPVKDIVGFDTFEKLDIRVGRVLECEKVPKADKLLRFLIDDGVNRRTIVSGIAKYYKPEDLIDKEVCFIANFEPRKLKGVVSEGMILSAQNSDGRLIVIGPHGEVSPGSSVG